MFIVHEVKFFDEWPFIFSQTPEKPILWHAVWCDSVNFTAMPMMRACLLFAFFLWGWMDAGLAAQNIDRSTHVYAQPNGEALELDVHRTTKGGQFAKPVVIFVHGGGFYTGTRKEANIVHFCDSLAQAGFVAVNLQYRLFMKGRSFSCNEPKADKIKAIATAADDIRAATNWLLERSDSLQIDPSCIFLAGSSAGAEAILHAAYATRTAENRPVIPFGNDFSYCGLLSFAGAMLESEWITGVNALPTLFYHGNCDPLVPYGTAIHHYCKPEKPGAMLLYGSASLHERLERLGATSRLVTGCGGQHGSAVYPIEDDIALLIDFMRRVMNGEEFVEHEVRTISDKTCAYGPSPCD